MIDFNVVNLLSHRHPGHGRCLIAHPVAVGGGGVALQAGAREAERRSKQCKTLEELKLAENFEQPKMSLYN